jgi:hypothetical protein
MNYAQLSATISNYTENTEANFLAEIPVFVQQAEQRIYNTVQFPSLRKNVTGDITSQNKYLSAPADFLAVYSLALYPVGGGDYEYLLNKDVNFIRQAYPSATDYGTPKYYALFGPTTTSGASPVITNELSFILGPTPDAAYKAELHYYYYPESIVQTPVTTLGTITGGSAYANGTYLNVALTGGSGAGAVANIVISGGTVTSVVLTRGGTGYVIGDALSVAASTVGGTGAGFSIPVATVGNALGTSWLGDNFDSVLLYGSLVEAYTYMKGEQDMMALYNGKYQEALALAKRLGDGMERQDAYRSGQVRIQVT